MYQLCDEKLFIFLPVEGFGVLVMTSCTVCVVSSFVMVVLEVCDCEGNVVLAVLGTSVTLLSFELASLVIALDDVSVDEGIVVATIG